MLFIFNVAHVGLTWICSCSRVLTCITVYRLKLGGQAIKLRFQPIVWFKLKHRQKACTSRLWCNTRAAEQTIKLIAQKSPYRCHKGATGRNEALTKITYLFSSWDSLSKVFCGPVTWILQLAVCLLLGGGFLPSILLHRTLISGALHWAFDGEQRAQTLLYSHTFDTQAKPAFSPLTGT